jgi:hypothetical protein
MNTHTGAVDCANAAFECRVVIVTLDVPTPLAALLYIAGVWQAKYTDVASGMATARVQVTGNTIETPL